MSAKVRLALWLLSLAGAVAVAWWYFTPKPSPVGETTLAKPAAELKRIKKRDITPPKVAVYEPPAKAKLDLPIGIQDDPDKYVLGSVKLPNDTHPHTVTTVIDEKTGEIQTFDRRDPLPWLSVEQRGELRLDYGFKAGQPMTARLSLREDLLQVKALHAGINASLDADGQYFVGAGIGWKW